MKKESFLFEEHMLKQAILNGKILDINNLKAALNNKRNVLIGGPAGCGKSYLCNKLKEELNDINVIDLEFDEKIDEDMLNKTPFIATIQAENAIDIANNFSSVTGLEVDIILKNVELFCLMVKDKFIAVSPGESKSVLENIDSPAIFIGEARGKELNKIFETYK